MGTLTFEYECPNCEKMVRAKINLVGSIKVTPWEDEESDTFLDLLDGVMQDCYHAGYRVRGMVIRRGLLPHIRCYHKKAEVDRGLAREWSPKTKAAMRKLYNELIDKLAEKEFGGLGR